jgi:hypothetical protein
VQKVQIISKLTFKARVFPRVKVIYANSFPVGTTQRGIYSDNTEMLVLSGRLSGMAIRNILEANEKEDSAPRVDEGL